MKVLILDTLYSNFLNKIYTENTFLQEYEYEKQFRYLADLLFGTSDFYSSNLEKLNCESETLYINVNPLQLKWAQENNIKINFLNKNILFKNYQNRIIQKIIRKNLYKILEAQIRFCAPDVVIVMDPVLDNDFLYSIKYLARLWICQTASVLAPLDRFKGYDLILSSYLGYVYNLAKKGFKTEYFKLAFENKILDKLQLKNRNIECSFVGGMSGIRLQPRRDLLSGILKHNIKLDLYGYGIDDFKENTKIREFYKGPAWGKDMYNIFLSSKIVINNHSMMFLDKENIYANNMRLYEATGCGALLITDYKENLKDIFEIDKEVLAYKNVDELVEKMKYYLNNENVRKEIALAGQKRTLSEHTYFNRMKELRKIIGKYL